MSTPLLAGLQVLEVAHATTEYAGKVLAEAGATVFLIEEPGRCGGLVGDRVRSA